MKVCTLGNGFVADHLPYEKIVERFTLRDHDFEGLLKFHQPDVLINCLGRTGRPNVDWCESHQTETAFSNITLPILLAESCAKRGTHLIQLGSGCIYFGTSPDTGYGMYCGPDPNYKGHGTVDYGWKEENLANPQSYYSKTKYACDLALGEMDHVTTLRLRMPISEKNNSRNLINKLRGYKEVIDIPNSMTFMSDLVRCIDWAAHHRPGGIFHVANPQPLTAARIMQEFQKYVPEHKFEIIGERRLQDLVVAKRSNCILSTVKLQSTTFRMSNSEEELAYCMRKYFKNLQQEGLYVK